MQILLESADGAKIFVPANTKDQFLSEFKEEGREIMGEAYDDMLENGYHYNSNPMNPDENFSIHSILRREGNYYIIQKFSNDEYLCSGVIMADGSLDLELGDVEVIGKEELHFVNEFFQRKFDIPLDMYDI